MMYTKGIRKIFADESMLTLEGVKKLARLAGYYAFTYNGSIFVREFKGAKDIKVIEPWIRTCLHVTDFSDGQV